MSTWPNAPRAINGLLDDDPSLQISTIDVVQGDDLLLPPHSSVLDVMVVLVEFFVLCALLCFGVGDDPRAHPRAARKLEKEKGKRGTLLSDVLDLYHD